VLKLYYIKIHANWQYTEKVLQRHARVLKYYAASTSIPSTAVQTMRPLYQNPTEWQYTKKVLKHFGCNKKVYSCHFLQDRLYFVHQIEKETK
jgi:hypothetical protein